MGYFSWASYFAIRVSDGASANVYCEKQYYGTIIQINNDSVVVRLIYENNDDIPMPIPTFTVTLGDIVFIYTDCDYNCYTHKTEYPDINTNYYWSAEKASIECSVQILTTITIFIYGLLICLFCMLPCMMCLILIIYGGFLNTLISLIVAICASIGYNIAIPSK